MFNKYWTQQEISLLETATDFSELKDIALIVLRRMQRGIVQVCGPISTGGLGSVEANISRFDEVITRLTSEGENVFDQIPFEDSMHRIKEQRPCDGYNFALLEEFYAPIFESGLIWKFYFLQDWQSSVGARWEHEQACKLNIEKVFLL